MQGKSLTVLRDQSLEMHLRAIRNVLFDVCNLVEAKSRATASRSSESVYIK